MRCVRRAARPHGALCEPRFQPRMQHAAASVVTLLPCATGQGSGRLPGPAQSKQDALIKEIMTDHDLAMPPVLAPATTRDKLV